MSWLLTSLRSRVFGNSSRFERVKGEAADAFLAIACLIGVAALICLSYIFPIPW